MRLIDAPDVVGIVVRGSRVNPNEGTPVMDAVIKTEGAAVLLRTRIPKGGTIDFQFVLPGFDKIPIATQAKKLRE